MAILSTHPLSAVSQGLHTHVLGRDASSSSTQVVHLGRNYSSTHAMQAQYVSLRSQEHEDNMNAAFPDITARHLTVPSANLFWNLRSWHHTPDFSCLRRSPYAASEGRHMEQHGLFSFRHFDYQIGKSSRSPWIGIFRASGITLTDSATLHFSLSEIYLRLRATVS
jgi:hypothetical protein